MRVDVETQWSVVSPTITNDMMSFVRKYSSSVVPINALLTVLVNCISPGSGLASSLKSYPCWPC